jgi:hypothetical protein
LALRELAHGSDPNVAKRIARGESVTAPGIPLDCPSHAELISDDCICASASGGANGET